MSRRPIIQNREKYSWLRQWHGNNLYLIQTENVSQKNMISVSIMNFLLKIKKFKKFFLLLWFKVHQHLDSLSLFYLLFYFFFFLCRHFWFESLGAGFQVKPGPGGPSPVILTRVAEPILVALVASGSGIRKSHGTYIRW